MEFVHYSVLKNEAIENLCVNPDGIYADATLGGGGHSLEIARKLRGGRLICIDRDSDAIEFSKHKLQSYSEKITFVKDNYSNMEDILKRLNIDKLNGIIADLGVSSHQIGTPVRGFSYLRENDAPLDMRMDTCQDMTAKIVVNEFPAEKLRKIISSYGEEKYADFFVREIVRYRDTKEIQTTGELSDILLAASRKVKYNGGHPAKKTFQAIRIFVNAELEDLPSAIDGFFRVLAKGGRLAVITFHSLEDRCVKQMFMDYANDCVCPKNLPVCVCDKVAEAKIITKKPVYPSKSELEENTRSLSAKMRVIEKIV